MKIQAIGVSAFIYYDNSCLILKRSDSESYLPGYYELPGGHLEFGEDPEQALIRELKEETSLAVKILNPYHCFSYLNKDKTKHTADIQYLSIILSDNPEVKLSAEHDEFRWVTEDDLGHIKNISSEMKTAIQKGFGAINR